MQRPDCDRLITQIPVVDLRQGHGIRVVGTPERSVVLTKIAELLKAGRQHGYTRAELIRMLERAR